MQRHPGTLWAQARRISSGLGFAGRVTRTAQPMSTITTRREPMSPESSGSMEPDDARRPDDDWPGDAPGDDQTGPSWPEAAQGAAGGDGRSGGQDGGWRRQHLRPLVLA